MQTQVMEKRVVGVPWLERYREGMEPEQFPIHSFPFSIGRVESADLQIDDARVSREHAVILREGKTYRARDLQSTNGTVLNGQRVQDAELSDGDILVIADVEFTFFTGHGRSSYAMATEVIGPASAATSGREQTRDLIVTLRRMQQVLTARSIDVHFRPIVNLESREIAGYEALRGGGEETPISEKIVLSAANRITGRLQQLTWLLSIEEGTRNGLGDHLFLPVESSEIGSEHLLDSLARLARARSPRQQLVVAIQENGVCDIPYFQTLCERLRDLDIRTAYHGFAGKSTHVFEKQSISPDFLVLSPALVRDIHRLADRQRQVQAIARACREVGCLLVAAGLANEAEAQACRDLGCRFGQGDVFGRPARATALGSPRSDSGLPAGLMR